MFGIATPMGRTPLQGASLDVTSPRAKSPWAILLDRSAVIRKCPNSSDRFAVWTAELVMSLSEQAFVTTFATASSLANVPPRETFGCSSAAYSFRLTLGPNRGIAQNQSFIVLPGEHSPAPIDKGADSLLRAVEQDEMHAQPC